MIDPKRLNDHMRDSINGIRNEEFEQKILTHLEVDSERGVNSNELKNRKKIFGRNIMPEKKPLSYIYLLGRAFNDITVIILTISALISIILGSVFPSIDPKTGQKDKLGWIEGFAIAVAVALITNVTAALNWDKARKFKQLSQSDILQAKVLRDGDKKEIDAKELVVGDVIDIVCGDKIPSDGILLSSSNLSIDESSLTGENLPVEKSVAANRLILSNTMVLQGHGKMVVCAVGEHTMWGNILKSLVEQEATLTPIQVYINKVATSTGVLGLLVGITIFFILSIYWAIDTSKLILQRGWEAGLITGLIENFTIAVTIIVVAVPEGLPLAVTITLAYSMKAMLKDQNLVRNLSSCETMGGVNDICSDKTGTLTMNKMTVVKGYFGLDYFFLNEENQCFTENSFKDVYMQDFLYENIYLNSNTTRQDVEEDLMNGEEENSGNCFGCGGSNEVVAKKNEIIGGNPTEMALVDLMDLLSEKPSYHKRYREVNQYKILQQYPFDSTIKKMFTVIKTEDEDTCRLLVKGAPDQLIQCLRYVLEPSGELVEATSKYKQRLMEMVKTLSEEGLRTLMICYRDFPRRIIDKMNEKEEEKTVIKILGEEEELTYVALFGIEDPIRKEVPDAIAQCKKAGINVRMLTGDFEQTARKIGETCGILTDKSDIVLTGEQFRKKSDEEIMRILPNLKIMARSLPSDKHRLVLLLQKSGSIVSVTGDGTNDAQALKSADVGISMGSGTNVAKEASDVIILDDNFNSIVKSVRWGRCVFENIRKFVQFQLVVILSAVIVSFIGMVTKQGIPLRAIQLLWMNLIMDTSAALSLATEPPYDALMDDPPHGKKERFLTNTMIKNILIQVVFQVTALLLILYLGYKLPSRNIQKNSIHHFTILFNTFVCWNIFNQLNSRTIKDQIDVFTGFIKNKSFFFLFFLACGLHFIVIHFGGVFFKVVSLDIIEWIFCVGVGASSLLIGVVSRMIPVPKKHFFDYFVSNQPQIEEIELN